MLPTLECHVVCFFREKTRVRARSSRNRQAVGYFECSNISGRARAGVNRCSVHELRTTKLSECKFNQ